MENNDTDLKTLGKKQSVFKCLEKGHDAKQASLPLVLLSQPVLCPLMPEGLGMAFLAVFLAVSHGAWHLVEFSGYLWNRFLPILLFVISNSKDKQ